MINIFLTCTVYPRNNISWLKQRDPKERINMYLEIIELWMENTNLNLTIIENSGYEFTELKNKFHINHLEVCGRFQRRGGIDINPIRGTHKKKLFANFREFNQ